MKKLLTLAAVATLANGCAYHRTIERTYNPDTNGYDITQFTQIAWFNKQATKGLIVGKRTNAGSTTLSVAEATTETQADALRAVAEGVAAGMMKGVKPVP